MTRNRSTLLATWLTETGDLALAADICTEGLAQSRNAGDPWNVACQLIALADLDRRAGRREDAAAHLWEATQIVARTGIWFELDNILESCWNLCTTTGRYAEALTLRAAMAALSQSAVTETAYWVARHRDGEREARHALGPDRASTAEERGAAMSRAVIIEYVLLLTAPVQQTASPPDPDAAIGRLQSSGAGADHAGRAGSYRRPDRHGTVHQRPRGGLAPGPGPGQDRLPPPRRPDTAGLGRGPDLAQSGDCPAADGRDIAATDSRVQLPGLQPRRSRRRGPGTAAGQ